MAARQPKATAPKLPPPTAEAVAARLLELFPAGEAPTLWKAADLKKKLPAKEKPLLVAALAKLEADRQMLALKQGKTSLYLFAEPLREWLAAESSSEDLSEVYTRLVRQSGGFPDVKIATLKGALDPTAAGALSERLIALWREGRATFGQGDWSLADDAARASAVELNGERYLLVRLEL